MQGGGIPQINKYCIKASLSKDFATAAARILLLSNHKRSVPRKRLRLRKQFRAMREVLNETPFEERSFKLPQAFFITICLAIQNALSYIGASIMQGVVHTLWIKIKNEPSA